MLIDQFIFFLKEASQFPRSLWDHNYRMARRSFLADITSIKLKIKKATASSKKLDTFLALLEKQNPDEFKLAEGFVSLGEILRTSGMTDAHIEQYHVLSERFLKRVKHEEKFKKLRATIQKKLSQTEQQEYDHHLFQNEGLNYCLLYYLTYYKVLTSIHGEGAKKAFIIQPEVNLGFGNAPGIHQDFEKDESLEKFILLILDEHQRTALVREYYVCKQVILNGKSPSGVESALHEFLFALLSAFNQRGMTVAANAFFAPYGKDATVKEILSFFQVDYAPR